MDTINNIIRYALIVSGLITFLASAGAAAYLGWGMYVGTMPTNDLYFGATFFAVGMAVASAVAANIGYSGMRKQPRRR